MRKNKILSTILAMAMAISIMPSAISAANSNVIYSEDYNGDVSFQHTAGAAPTVENGMVLTPPSGSEGGFWFDSLDAKVADAPLGKIRVKFDFKSPDTGAGATKMGIKTDAKNINLISYGVWGCLRVTELSDELGSPGFEANAWHENEFILDFVNNKIIYTVTNKNNGSKPLDGFELAKDLSGITAIKGFDLYGWAGTGYFDNLLIEYVGDEETPDTPDTPDDPEFSAKIYSEDYNNGYNFPHTEGNAAPTVENGMVLTPPSGSEGGFWFDSLNAAVADAPLGKIRVRFDFKSHDPGPAATKMTLKTNAGNVTFLSYGLYGSIRDDALSNATGNPGFTPNVWHDNDIVFDFANNKIIYNVTNKETGAKVFDNFELSKDLSGITHVKGFDLYGWAGITYFDNLLIEYVVENETPEIPDEPEFEKDIFAENFDGKTLTDIAGTIDTAPSIVDGVVKLAQSGGSGFKFTSFEAEAKGQVRVKFDLNAPNVDTAATTTKVLTNSGGIPLVSYGVWGGIRPTQLGEPIGGAGFAGDVWYVNDIILDFDNNKIIYTITGLESGDAKLSEYAVDYDLSAVTKINGFEMYGWAGPAKLDNLVIEYVVEEETPEIPDEPEIIKDIFSENYDGKTLTDIASTIDAAPSIVDGVVKLAQSGGSGFKFTSFEAEAKGQVRVKFEMSAPNVDTAATTTKVLTNAGGIPLVSYGVWGGIRPTQMEEPIGGAGFDGDVWYVNDIVLDFDNNKIIYTITELESGDAKLSEYAVDYDLSAVTKINGFEMYGWAGPAKLDNLVIEYVVEETPETPEIPDEPEIIKDIFSENYDGKTLTDIASTIDNAPSIVDGVVKLAQSGGSGFKFTSFEAEAKGQVRVKFEMSAPNVDTAATTTKVLTNAGGIPLVSYGVWGGIRPTQMEEPIGGAGFDGDVWYVNDIVLDFDNNKIIYTITALESGDAKLSAYAVDYDLSAVSKINGFEMYGWAGPAMLDNLVIEYVVEEETPEIPEDPDFTAGIYAEEYDGKTLTDFASTIDTAPSIVDGVVKLAQTGGSGFKFTSLNADAKGQVRVKFDTNAPNVDTSATTAKLHVDSGSVPLISYGTWGGIRPTWDSEPLGGAGYIADTWYENDIVLDFDANKIIYTITEKETGIAAVSEYAIDYDLSAVNKIKGFEFYGWAGPAMLDNLVIEYTSKDPYVSADKIKIFADDKEQKHASVNPGADKIEIDFVGVLKESSLENAVVITNVTDNTTVEYTSAVVGSRYIMSLSEGLAPSKQFKLTISPDVENIFGVKLGGEHAFSFATNAGYVNIKSISLTQNGNAVENLAGLTAGQEAKVKIDFEKTSNDERKIKLIYAYYNGTQLVKNVVKTVTIGVADRAGAKEDIQVIEDLGGITSVSVMVWENFQTIKPLCEDIKLN